MERRDFIRAAVAGGVAARAGAADSKLRKRTYRDGVELSVIGFGGIVVVGMEQKDAGRVVAQSIERGVNYFDVAPSYWDGEAEQKLGIALEPYRKNVFLACKTTKRDAAGSRQELEQSLRRLKTDHFDLYQFHAVTKMDEVEQIFAKGGAAETFERARKEGQVRFLGCSAHSEAAAIAMMDRIALDSILFPINYVLYANGDFGPRVIAHAKRKGVARLALKALAHRPWPEGARKNPKTWYEPVTDRVLADKALRFTLSEDITAAIPPGDENLFRMALDIASDFKPLASSERESLLASAKGTEPIFQTPSHA